MGAVTDRYDLAKETITLVRTSSIRGLKKLNQDNSELNNSFSLFTLPGCCCITGGGGDRRGSTAVALLTIAAVFSFFVGMYYSFKSLSQNVDCNRALSKVQLALNSNPTVIYVAQSNFPPQQGSVVQQFATPTAPSYPTHGNSPYPPTFTNIQSSNPFDQPTYSQNPPPVSQYIPQNQQLYPPTYQNPPTQVVDSVFRDAQIILTKLRTESKFETAFRVTMTLGFGLLTTALVVTFLAETEFLVIALAISGGGTVVVGATGLGLKHAFVKWESHEQKAYDRLRSEVNSTFSFT